MAISAGFALQQAVFAALKASAPLIRLLGATRIYDAPPSRPAYPYIVLGPHALRDFSSSDSQGREHILTVTAYSRSPGLQEAYALADAISAATTAIAALPADHRLILLRFDSADVRREADALTARASVIFRAISEPNIQGV